MLTSWGKIGHSGMFVNEPLLGKLLSRGKWSSPISSHINSHHMLWGKIMTPNSLNSLTFFAFLNESATTPEAQPACLRNQATMDSDQIAPTVHAPYTCGHLPMGRVMCLCYTSIGLNPPVTSIKNGQSHHIIAFFIYKNHCHWVQADYLPH